METISKRSSETYIPLSVRQIVREVREKHRLSELEFERPSKHGPAHARFEAYYRIRREVRVNGGPPSYPKIGSWFGVNHASVMHGEAKHAAKVRRHSAKLRPQPHRLQMLSDFAEACGWGGQAKDRE